MNHAMTEENIKTVGNMSGYYSPLKILCTIQNEKVVLDGRNMTTVITDLSGNGSHTLMTFR